MYEVMRYWDQDQPDWDEVEHDYAQVWRPKPKWVASHSLTLVGPNATLVQNDLTDFAANIKPERDGDHRCLRRGACERAALCGPHSRPETGSIHRRVLPWYKTSAADSSE
jgi:hypothetical protein